MEMNVSPAAQVDHQAGERRVSLRRCDRCGGSHVPIVFKPFSMRDIGRWTHYSLCPNTNEPVLMRFEGKDTVAA